MGTQTTVQRKISANKWQAKNWSTLGQNSAPEFIFNRLNTCQYEDYPNIEDDTDKGSGDIFCPDAQLFRVVGLKG